MTEYEDHESGNRSDRTQFLQMLQDAGIGDGPVAGIQEDELRLGGNQCQVPHHAQFVVTQPTAGQFKAFSAICTHQGCTVEYDRPDRVLICPCHSAVFDPASDAQVLQGPPPVPLTKLPIVVDQASGSIYLSA